MKLSRMCVRLDNVPVDTAYVAHKFSKVLSIVILYSTCTRYKMTVLYKMPYYTKKIVLGHYYTKKIVLGH